MNSSEKLHNRTENPITKVNFLSRITFWWVRKLLYKGYRRPLTEEEIYANPEFLNSEQITDKYNQLWNDELKTEKPSLIRMIRKDYGLVLFCTALIVILDTIAKLTEAYCLGGLLVIFSTDRNDKLNAYLYASGLIICILIPPFLYNLFSCFVDSTNGRIRLGLCGLIYKKVLTSSRNILNESINSQAINIMANDLAKFEECGVMLQYLFKGPFQIFILGYFMYLEIGISVLAGIFFILLLIPVQIWGSRKQGLLRKKVVELTDSRVKLMNEIVQGIQVIKMYAWENSFANLVAIARKKEIKAVRTYVAVLGLWSAILMSPKISIFSSLVCYVYFGDEIIARKVFIVSSLFNALCFNMAYLWPYSCSYYAQLYVTCCRVQNFFLNKEDKELNLNIFEKKGYINEAYKFTSINLELEKCASEVVTTQFGSSENTVIKRIILKKAFASWDKKIDIMNDFNMEINDGILAVIIGNVGSGKSSFFNAILGELKLASGNMLVNGKVSYCSQEPWIFESSIKNNIVFIEVFDESRYKKVVEVCFLEEDFKLFPYGDSTIVGEKGVSLSGGQKSRISLARAIYKTADIYLLDDPLSAVDTLVGKKIFEKCILNFLSDKTRVLITHQLQHLKNIEHIYLLKGGKIQSYGNYYELEKVGTFEILANKQVTTTGKSVMTISENSYETEKIQENDLEREEQQSSGSVKLTIYKTYFKTLHNALWLSIIVGLFIFLRAGFGGIDYFISRWADWEENLVKNITADFNVINFYHGNDLTLDEKRLNIVFNYTLLIVIIIILYICESFSYFFMCVRIGENLHDKLFRGIARASMYFFNINSTGRILNRFSKDIYTIDFILPQTIFDCVTFLGNLITASIIIALTNYKLIFPALLLGSYLYVLRAFYINGARSLKRLEAISRSSVYSHVNQTFYGLTTIRAFKAEKVLENNFNAILNQNIAPWYMSITSMYGFSLWVDLGICLYIAIVIFGLIAFGENVSSGDIGLVIFQCVFLIEDSKWGMKQTTDIENQMISVERVNEFIQEPAEDAEFSKNSHSIVGWPKEGHIRFKNFNLRYSKNGDLVLKNLNFYIRANEKIGIVGRTGAGKSSIIQAIFRLAFNQGMLEIDDIDINKINLYELRKNISIIPQDPVLFSGSLRYNLDPFGTKCDDELWQVLEEVKLKNYIIKLAQGLDLKVLDGGLNFSVGQRQLVCLARAIIRKNKILILDEATANVDLETDKLIQTTIRKKFSNCTVLTIAHRLYTVMDSDQIIVMDKGSVVEMGSPEHLLQIPKGFFRSLAEQNDSF